MSEQLSSKTLGPIPRPVRVLTGTLCAATLLSALAGGAWGVMALWPRVAWPLVGFEIVTILACGFGLLVARGKYAEAPGLTILCVAGVVLTGGVLGYLGANKSHGGIDLKPFMLARLGIAGILSVLAATAEVWYSAVARRTLAKAVMYAVVMLAIVGVLYAMRNSPLLAQSTGAREAARLVGMAVASILALIGACGAAHLSIRAFAIAHEPETTA